MPDTDHVPPPPDGIKLLIQVLTAVSGVICLMVLLYLFYIEFMTGRVLSDRAYYTILGLSLSLLGIDTYLLANEGLK